MTRQPAKSNENCKRAGERGLPQAGRERKERFFRIRDVNAKRRHTYTSTKRTPHKCNSVCDTPPPQVHIIKLNWQHKTCRITSDLNTTWSPLNIGQFSQHIHKPLVFINSFSLNKKFTVPRGRSAGTVSAGNMRWHYYVANKSLLRQHSTLLSRMSFSGKVNFTIPVLWWLPP